VDPPPENGGVLAAATLETASDAELEVSPSGQILWQGRTVAFLQRGRTVNTPHVMLRDTDSAAGPKLQHIARYLRGQTEALHAKLGPLRTSREPELRALGVALESGLGALWTSDFGFELPQLLAAAERDAAAWEACGIHASALLIYAEAALAGESFALRCALVTTHHELSHSQQKLLVPGANTIAHGDMDAHALLGLGFAKLGNAALRVDLAARLTLERIAMAQSSVEAALVLASEVASTVAALNHLMSGARERLTPAD
jgi:hypothetical protein